MPFLAPEQRQCDIPRNERRAQGQWRPLTHTLLKHMNKHHIQKTDGTTAQQPVALCETITVVISDGTFLHPYDNRICYFDTLIEQF